MSGLDETLRSGPENVALTEQYYFRDDCLRCSLKAKNLRIRSPKVSEFTWEPGEICRDNLRKQQACNDTYITDC